MLLRVKDLPFFLHHCQHILPRCHIGPVCSRAPHRFPPSARLCRCLPSHRRPASHTHSCLASQCISSCWVLSLQSKSELLFTLFELCGAQAVFARVQETQQQRTSREPTPSVTASNSHMASVYHALAQHAAQADLKLGALTEIVPDCKVTAVALVWTDGPLH